MKTPKRKARKPRDFMITTVETPDGGKALHSGICIATDCVLAALWRVQELKEKDCRKLAAWLIKAAEYLEEK